MPAVTVQVSTNQLDSGTYRVERMDQVEVYRRVAEEAFCRDEQDTAAQLAAALAAGSTQHRGYITYHADQPVSVGRRS